MEHTPNDIEAQMSEVEAFEGEISMALEFGPIEQSAKDDLLSRIDIQIAELRKNPEPLLSEAAVETLVALRDSVVEHPVRTPRTSDDDLEDQYEDSRRSGEEGFKKAA